MATSNGAQHVSIIDIRRDKIEESLVKSILSGLKPQDGGEKSLPTLLLYDEAGLKLFEKITYLDEYYLTNAEIEVLKTHADKIAERIPDGGRLVELGSGNLRKVEILLDAFERAKKNVEYYALDLSLAELQRTFLAIPPGHYSYVRCFGLHGTYDDGLVWLNAPENRAKSTCILTLGSSIGNFSREDVPAFLNGYAKTMTISDMMLVGLDSCQDRDRIYKAYNDSKGVTHEFYRNGLSRANKVLGHEAFKQDDWQIIGRYDEPTGRHEAFYSPIRDVSILGVKIAEGEQVRIEEAYKYTAAESDSLWYEAGLIRTTAFGNSSGDYYLHMLSSPRFEWSTKPEQYASKPVPTLQEWAEVWAAWDAVTRGMIPQEELLAKPIQLRNNLIFYLGHIPTFVDIHLTRATNGKPTSPASYPSIFERGIDPDVDNPELCHDHSEIPDTWPPLEEILEFQVAVRNRIKHLYRSGAASNDRKLGRALWLGFEHEIMHLETFLYMLLQSDRVVPPPGWPIPDFQQLAKKAAAAAVPNEWIEVPGNKITIGLDDPENDIGPDRYFGWDNERPPREVLVAPFIAQARPITNGEYARFLEQNHIERVPASWSVLDRIENETNGMNGIGSQDSVSKAYLSGKSVRTVHGPVPLQYALDWPVMASYDELAAYAMWMNGRIPTLEEVKSIYSYVESLKTKKLEQVPSSLISAVNGHLVNEGVEETPPFHRGLNSSSNGEHSPKASAYFTDLEGCNVGFKHLHPTPVTQNGHRLSGQSDLGGVWEWTSSALESFEGFKAMDLYPGYTADFFDGKHNVVLGGSWSTHPRVAGRKSFINWYQRNYPYAWTGARLVRDK